MFVPRVTFWRQLLVVSCLLFVLAAPAAASPDAVILDYGDNGRVDADHSLADLRSALDIWQENPQYGAFVDEVTAAIDRRLLGVAASAPAEPPVPAPGPDDPPRAQPAPPAVPGNASVEPATPPAPGQVGDLEGEIVPAAALDTLPSPPLASADPGRPLALMAFAAVALALVLAGLGAAAYRRVRP